MFHTLYIILFSEVHFGTHALLFTTWRLVSKQDIFNHELTIPQQMFIAIIPNFFTTFKMRQGKILDENETKTLIHSYDFVCATTLIKGRYPILFIDPVP